MNENKNYVIGYYTKNGVQEHYIYGNIEYFPEPEKPKEIHFTKPNDEIVKFDYYSVEYCYEKKDE